MERADKPTLQGYVLDCTKDDATVYTDEARAYVVLPRNHAGVNHSVGEYVNEMTSTNGLKPHWTLMKRGYQGVYHKMSPKHLQRYVRGFAGKHNDRNHDTIDQMTSIALRMVGRRLTYEDLIGPVETRSNT